MPSCASLLSPMHVIRTKPKQRRPIVMHALIEQLENLKARPAMFFGTDDDVEAAIHFFNGFNAAASTLLRPDEPWRSEHYRAVLETRGWKMSARHPAREMKEKSLNNREVVAELIEIELASWRAFFGAEQV